MSDTQFRLLDPTTSQLRRDTIRGFLKRNTLTIDVRNITHTLPPSRTWLQNENTITKAREQGTLTIFMCIYVAKHKVKIKAFIKAQEQPDTYRQVSTLADHYFGWGP